MSMTYSEALKNLLRPMGIYNVDEGFGALELEALGQEMDGIFEALIGAENDLFPVSAGDEALSRIESIMPYIPKSTDISERRSAISALMQIDDFGFSESALNRALSGCGISARVREGDEKYHVVVRFPDRRGMPESFEDLAELEARIAQILPCHLAVEYEISFFNWAQLERTYLTWQQLEAGCASWYQLERSV